MNKWTEEEIEYLKDNYGKLSTKEISKKLNRPISGINLKASRLGIKFFKRSEYDRDYFKVIDSEEKAYWLGFIYADGWTSYNYDKGHFSFGIELKESDDNHLKKFIESINGNVKINYRKREHDYKTKFTTHTCLIRLHSREFVSNLIKLGVNKDKTYTLKFPNFIDSHLMRHFIRGYIDGDGFISFYKNKKYGYRCRMGFVCKSKDFANGLIDFLENEIEGKLLSNIDRGSIAVETSNQNQLKVLINYLYEDSSIYLDRKYEKYLELNHYLHNRLAYRKRNLTG